MQRVQRAGKHATCLKGGKPRDCRPEIVFVYAADWLQRQAVCYDLNDQLARSFKTNKSSAHIKPRYAMRIILTFSL